VSETRYIVAIIVDPEFGERVREVLQRMPVWLVDSEVNRRVAEAIWEGHRADHTQPGGLTTFRADPARPPDEQCAAILRSIAGHHDEYSHHPGYSGVEVFGAAPTPALVRALAEYRLTAVRAFPGGFAATTAGGERADSPNYSDASTLIDGSGSGSASPPPAA